MTERIGVEGPAWGSRARDRAAHHRAELLAATAASEDAPGHLVLESCHSTWLFDTTMKRFCRLLHREPDGHPPVVTEWRSYFRLLLRPDSEAFVVMLDASGTRLLRSWRHLAQCEQCGGNVTSEYSLEELRRAAGS